MATAVAGFGFLDRLPALTAQEVQAPRNIAAVAQDLEPIVRLIEDTPRDRLTDIVIERIRQGTTYQELFRRRRFGRRAWHSAAAGGVQVSCRLGDEFRPSGEPGRREPRSLASPDLEPGQLQSFAKSQSRRRRLAYAGTRRFAIARRQFGGPPLPRGDGQLARGTGRPGDRRVVAARQGPTRFTRRFGVWAAAISAISGIRRSSSRILTVPSRPSVGGTRSRIRSLAYALLQHEGTNPAERNGAPDRPGRDNLTRLTRIYAEWRRGRPRARRRSICSPHCAAPMPTMPPRLLFVN